MQRSATDGVWVKKERERAKRQRGEEQRKNIYTSSPCSAFLSVLLAFSFFFLSCCRRSAHLVDLLFLCL